MWGMLRHNLFFGSRRRDRSGPALYLILFLAAVILGIGYLLSQLMRFALSRKREYMADAGAVEMTKNPDAMMRALMRIAGRDRIPEASEDIAMMCIENHKSFLGIFATHPPIEKRIKAISSVTNTPVPDAMSLPPVKKAQSFSSKVEARHLRKNPWIAQ